VPSGEVPNECRSILTNLASYIWSLLYYQLDLVGPKHEFSFSKICCILLNTQYSLMIQVSKAPGRSQGFLTDIEKANYFVSRTKVSLLEYAHHE